MRCAVRGSVAFFPATFHDLGNGMILVLRAIAEEEFCSVTCRTMVGT